LSRSCSPDDIPPERVFVCVSELAVEARLQLAAE
jgi:hypothetical protein